MPDKKAPGVALVQAVADDTPPPKGLEPAVTQRKNLSIEAVMAECHKRGYDPHVVMAEVFAPDVIEEMGHAVAARFALDLLKLDQGDKVTIHADINHGHSDIGVSDTERILGEVLSTRQKGARKKPGKA